MSNDTRIVCDMLVMWSKSCYPWSRSSESLSVSKLSRKNMSKRLSFGYMDTMYNLKSSKELQNIRTI